MSKFSMNFKGKVINGRFFPFDIDSYETFLHSLEDREVVATIGEFKKDRTDPQLRYYWGVVVRLISETTGYSKDEVHSILGTMFLKDSMEFNGKNYTVIKSISSIKSDAFSEYIEQCKAWASMEISCYIPDAERVSV